MFSIVCLLSVFCSNFDTLLEVKDVHWWKNLMPNYKLQRVSLLLVKTEPKNHICNRFYGISCEGPVLMEQVLKKCWYQHFEQFPGNCFSNFSRYRAILPNFIYMPNFRSIGPFKQKLQMGTESALPRPYQSAKSSACLGLKPPLCITSIPMKINKPFCFYLSTSFKGISCQRKAASLVKVSWIQFVLIQQVRLPTNFKVIGIRPLAPVQNSVSLKLMQGKTLNFVIYLPDVENITKWLDSILIKVNILKRFYTLEFILSVQSQICSILNIVKLREN